MLIRIIRKLFEAPLSEVMQQYVFKPCNFIETGWCKNSDDNLVWLNEEYADDQGGEANLACLVIPEHRLVAVRMYNQAGPNPPGYDYLEDIKAFGDKVLTCTLN
ncbi:penicillin-binding protein [Paenibacillus sp. FSL R7-269]|nr:penicillin-binding protein [Paenibacillus sp. FSL R7-269]